MVRLTSRDYAYVIRMSRRGRLLKAARWVALVTCGLLLILLVPPLRNLVLWPVWPGSWRVLSAWEIVTVYSRGVSGSHRGMLRPCIDAKIQPARATSSLGDYDFVQARERDVKLLEKARNYVAAQPPERAQRLAPYLPIMTLTDKARLLALWRVLDDTLLRWNISYFLSEGTLLGAVRHHGMIPWDDDLDISVWLEDVERLQRALSCLEGYALRVQDNYHYKFFNDRASVVSAQAGPLIMHAEQYTEEEKRELEGPLRLDKIETIVMRYPFIDIFIVQTSGPITSALTDYSVFTTAYRTEDVLPLVLQDFEGYQAPVPVHSLKLMRAQYNYGKCLSPFHNHRYGVGLDNTTSIPCLELRDMYPLYGYDTV